MGVLFVIAILLAWYFFRPKNEGTPEEMAADPNLNTQIWEVHYKRLKDHGKSKYRGEWEYMGPRGGIYTITASGNRNYRY